MSNKPIRRRDQVATPENTNTPAFAIRTTLWWALLTVHSLFLAGAFAVVFASKLPASLITTIIACSALIGIILMLFLMASAFARAEETQHTHQYKLTKSWAKNRPKIWHAAEILSVLAFFVCAACLLVVVARGS